MTDQALIDFTAKLDKYNDLEVKASFYEAVHEEYFRKPTLIVDPEMDFIGIASDGTIVTVIVSVCPDEEHEAICLSLQGTCTVKYLREHLHIKGICACPPSEDKS